MTKINECWGNAIRNLLDRHGLSLRGAEIKSKGVVTRTYISEWTTGKLPQYETAVRFLEHFPTDEAIECLRAGGFPVPEEWRDESEDLIERAERAFRGRVSDDDLEMIKAQLRIIQEEIQKRSEGGST
ncbi:MAG: hypothetical protein ABFD54_04325 [Armatimonadota bacterium]